MASLLYSSLFLYLLHCRVMISFLVYLSPGTGEHLGDRSVSELCVPSATQSLAHKEEFRVSQKMPGTEPGTCIYLSGSRPRLHIANAWGVLTTARALTPQPTNSITLQGKEYVFKPSR